MKACKLVVVSAIALGLSFATLQFSASGEPATSDKKPNLLIDISAALVNAVVQRSVDKTDPVQEIIQDSPVHGMARTIGNVSPELVPNARHAVLDVFLRGNVYSRTIATRPHVFLSTTTEIPLEVSNRIVIDEKGARIFHGRASATATTTLHGVSSRAEPDVIGMRVAGQLFQKHKKYAEAESASKTAWRASNELAAELTPALTAASDALKAVRKAGLVLESMKFSTSADSMHANFCLAAPGRSGAGVAPALPDGIDLGVRVHESLLNETAQALYGGKSFPLDKVNQLYEEVTLGMLIDSRKENVRKDTLKTLEKVLADLIGQATMTFARNNPMTVAIVEQGFTIEIQVDSIQEAKQAYAGSKVSAGYRLEHSAHGVHLVRKGPVRLVPNAATGKLKAAPASYVFAQEMLFAELLKERLTLAPLPMPAALSRLQLSTPRAATRGGWLGVVWNLK